MDLVQDVLVLDADQIVASTWLCHHGESVLAVRPHGTDVFFLPGGLPEPGESLAEAAAREANEEVGVHIDPGNLTEVVRVVDDAYGRPGATVTLVCFEGEGEGIPTVGEGEISELAWLRPSQWWLFAPAVRKALAKLAA